MKSRVWVMLFPISDLKIHRTLQCSLPFSNHPPAAPMPQFFSDETVMITTFTIKFNISSFTICSHHFVSALNPSGNRHLLPLPIYNRLSCTTIFLGVIGKTFNLPTQITIFACDPWKNIKHSIFKRVCKFIPTYFLEYVSSV